MIIKRSTYNEMLDLINQQRKEIEDLKLEGITNYHRRKKAEDMLCSLIRFISAKSDVNIDFPNSHTKGGNSANTGTDNINDILNL